MKKSKKVKEMLIRLSEDGRVMDTLMDYVDEHSDIAFIVVAGDKLAAPEEKAKRGGNGCGAMIHIKMNGPKGGGEDELIGIIIDGAKHAGKNGNFDGDIKQFLVKLGLVSMKEFGDEFGIKMVTVNSPEQ